MRLKITLLSDTTFGRGDGVAGVVDNEVEHDPRTGLPIIKGRTLKGLLVEACADILYSLKQSQSSAYKRFEEVAKELFGTPGSTVDNTGILHIGTATLPKDLERRVREAQYQYPPHQVLAALTSIRQQTAVDRKTDNPLKNTLRATRVVLRNTTFYAPIIGELNEDQKMLLAACAASVRRAGLNRTRGLGHVEMMVEELGEVYVARFAEIVKGAR
jgi:CRISPR/Cas system CSM-associated protein Csm3 (group 7 of RAMP superfamily)